MAHEAHSVAHELELMAYELALTEMLQYSTHGT